MDPALVPKVSVIVFDKKFTMMGTKFHQSRPHVKAGNKDSTAYLEFLDVCTLNLAGTPGEWKGTKRAWGHIMVYKGEPDEIKKVIQAVKETRGAVSGGILCIPTAAWIYMMNTGQPLGLIQLTEEVLESIKGEHYEAKDFTADPEELIPLDVYLNKPPIGTPFQLPPLPEHFRFEPYDTERPSDAAWLLSQWLILNKYNLEDGNVGEGKCNISNLTVVKSIKMLLTCVKNKYRNKGKAATATSQVLQHALKMLEFACVKHDEQYTKKTNAATAAKRKATIQRKAEESLLAAGGAPLPKSPVLNSDDSDYEMNMRRINEGLGNRELTETESDEEDEEGPPIVEAIAEAVPVVNTFPVIKSEVNEDGQVKATAAAKKSKTTNDEGGASGAAGDPICIDD